MIQSRSWLGLMASLVFLAFAVSTYASAQRGALTTPESIDELTQQSTLIVHGYVTSAKVEPHPQFHNLMTVLVTMNVEDTLKGSSQKSLQFRQYIWDIRDQLDAAKYAKNQELLLTLGPVSPYGLRSPVGLEQGRFRITRDSKGQALAVNGRGNLELFRATEQRASERGIKLSTRVTTLARRANAGPIPLADLKDAIRS